MSEDFKPVEPAQALQKLKEGNDRFANNIISVDSLTSASDRRSLAQKTQRPFAIILGCSDSRSPAELIFDQGLGDLFVIRVAGNIVAPSLVGSVEFAVSAFDTRLVVVMGHTSCGAVTATIDSLIKNRKEASENIQDILSRIRPHIEDLVDQELPREALMKRATRANIRASVNQLRHGSRILEDLANQKQIKIVGAEYNLETGKVEFLD